ncbi:MAG: hypothetical protein R3179_07330 [Sedimenticolaceae bacterium]|nr:hypothetical protein [Sedimenticolaceae bacterium]
MTETAFLLLAGLFLPLFPASMVFNWLLARTGNHLLRALLLLLWPQIGLLLLENLAFQVPDWLLSLALATSALYAFRVLAIRDIGQWCGFLATSSWAMLWIPLHADMPIFHAQLYALAFSVPLVLLSFLGFLLEQRFGAACTGLYGGLAESIPRFSMILVLVVLAIIATPIFPSFFIMTAMILQAMTTMPAVAVGIAGVWLLWSWAGAWLLQGLIIGIPGDDRPPDLNMGSAWGYASILGLLITAGIVGTGLLS